MRIAVIDDERPARSELSHLLLQALPDAVIREADRGSTALELVSAEPFDLVFIDIDLGDIKGTSLAMAVKKMLPQASIVFATAFSDYAVQAFEIGVSHYVLKPFDRDQIEGVIARYQQERGLLAGPPSSGKIAVTSGRKTILVELDQVVFLQTEFRGCRIHTLEESFQENIPIGEHERRLKGRRFLRVHKSFLVNLDHVQELIPWHNNGIALKMAGWADHPIPVARNNVRELKQMLGIQ